MLDSVKVEIGILDWGIKMTTLEDGKISISLASQTLTLHSVLVLSGKTRGGRVWPTAYARLDP